MPYTTHYTLTTNDFKSDLHQEAIEKISGFKMEEDCSWYNHEKDMTKYSSRHPTVLFILDGNGEQPGDCWRKWFLNGQMRVWRLELERPDYPEQPFS